MKFGAAFGINRTDWPSLRNACLLAEQSGWDSIWIEDHLLADEGDWHAPKFEGWAVLAAIAALTSRVRLGHLVVANTFRNPGLTAKLATTLDHLSNGRAVLGLGGGWFAREHEAFGIDFGTGVGERLDRLAEATFLIRKLLDGETVTHDGRFYSFREAVCAPRPIQQRLPILIGGSGPRKTLRIVAEHADIWNVLDDPAGLPESVEILRQHCAAVGRDIADIAITVNQVCVIRDDPRVALKVDAEIARTHGLEANRSGFGSLNAWGPPDAIAASMQPFVDLGVSGILWVFRSPFDLETVRRIGEVQLAMEAIREERIH
jgi:alkanesulfonate monooxygenase SsuD/methylene tetrahydromethanopterin reductase-like flavin-dependent oxidoreductase (luciferase family)